MADSFKSHSHGLAQRVFIRLTIYCKSHGFCNRLSAGIANAWACENGRTYFQTHASLLYREDGTLTGIVGVAYDLTDHKRLEQQLAHQAFHDSLTDLPARGLPAIVAPEQMTGVSSFIQADAEQCRYRGLQAANHGAAGVNATKCDWFEYNKENQN